MRQCEILLHRKRVGLLTETDNRDFIFTYDEDYAADPNSLPISLTMPVREEPYRAPYLFPVFANMLSEGENRMAQSQIFHLDENDDFGIMLESCLYDTIGAITVIPIKK